MKRTRFTRILAFCLAALMLCGGFGMTAAAATEDVVTDAGALSELLNASSYTAYNAKYASAGRGTGEVVIDAKKIYTYTDGDIVYYYDDVAGNFYYYDEANTRVDVADEDVSIAFGTYGGEEALYSPANGTIAWQVVIPKTGRYAVEIEYYPIGETTASIERVFYIDGKVPFSQARYLTLSKIWEYDYPRDENGDIAFKQDINGNELRPSASAKPEWTKYKFSDADGFYQGAFEFYFDNEGAENVTHTIALGGSREAMAIKSIRVYPDTDLPTYAEVLKSYKDAGYKAAGKDSFVKIEAEHPDRVSDTSVFAANDRTSAVNSPSSSSAQLMNVIGSTSYNTIGQWASYTMKVEKTGLYTISLRCKQDLLAGMYTSRALRISGGIYGEDLAVPFAEAYNIRFDYDKSWQIATMGDGENVFQFYLEAGEEYTIALDVSLGTLAEIIETVQDSLNVINNCYLEILKLTGTEPDQYRDYRFTRVMPEVITNLLLESKNLYAVSEALTNLCQSKGSHVATLDRVAFLLKTMGEDEGEKIAANLSNLKSYIGTLGTWLNTSKQQSLVMDYIVASGMEETTYAVDATPTLDGQFRANANFFESAWFEITSFFSSFVIDYNQMGVTEILDTNKRVEVWLATGRDQASIWRSQIDSTFTSTSAGEGIAVDLKLVAGGTLLPSVLAGQGPDVYMGLDSGSVINYAIRSAVLPITQYVENSNILDDFNEATLVPITMYNEIYGLPETVSFPMMFYRKDVLANLNLDVPKTWDDLLTYVPVFQSANMEIGLGRDYNMFLYQNGGDRWKYAGTQYEADGKYAELMQDHYFATYFDYMAVAFDENVALDAFHYMCRFFTDYSFPVAFDAANRFRTGEMPIVIADAVGMYNQLTVFATEIRGLWMFTNIPGTLREDGTVSSVSIAGVSANVMMNGVKDPESAWRFMSWMVSSDVQSTYGNGMTALIGPSAKYATANREALFKMSWTTEERNNLLAQYNNLATIPNYPGAYIIDRYLNFAFLNAYNDGKDSVEELQGYVVTINKEISRKRMEFELPIMDAGDDIDVVIEDYLNYLKGRPDEELEVFSDKVQEYIKSLR